MASHPFQIKQELSSTYYHWKQSINDFKEEAEKCLANLQSQLWASNKFAVSAGEQT